MKLVENGSFPIADIEIGKRLRMVDPLWAKGLAQVIEQTGLQNPIQIMRVGNSFRLVAGAHRMAAYKELGRTDIPAKVYEPDTDDVESEIRLQEIVENVARRELSALDRAAHIAELKDTLLKLNGETRGRKGSEKTANIAVFNLSDELSSRMQLSERTVRADVELFKALSPKVRARLNTANLQWLAENRAQLVALGKEKPEDQLAIIELIDVEEGEDAPANVSAAAALHHNKVDTSTPDEKHVASFVKLWAKASKKARKQMLAYAEKNVGA
jgi:ParB family transcriptional regulator, chromosome partitioning protein